MSLNFQSKLIKLFLLSKGGFLFKYINRQLMFVFFLTVMGLTLAAMPHVSSLTTLFMLAGINGFSIGSFDTAINVWILEIWQEDSGPFMQALHFTYGIGSFVAPLICEPFLSTESVHGGHGPPVKAVAAAADTATTYLPSTAITSTPSSVAPTSFLGLLNETGAELGSANGIDPVDFLIYIPYAIAGCITVMGALLILVLYYVNKYEPPKKPSKEYELKTVDENGESKHTLGIDHDPQYSNHRFHSLAIDNVVQKAKTPTLTIVLVGMGSLFLTFFVGMEQMHLQFLPTFAVNTDLNLSPSSAAMMSSVAALAFTIGRCLSIPLAIKLRPQTILYSNHLFMLIGCVLLAIYANSREDMLWLANAILGVGFSSVYASIYAFLEQQIRVTNRVGSIFVFAGGLTAAVSPSLVGQYIEANPLILVWFNLACCLLCLAIFVAIHLIVSFSQKRQKKRELAKENTLLSKEVNILTYIGDDHHDDGNVPNGDIENAVPAAENDDTISREKRLTHSCLIETDRARTDSNLNLITNNDLFVDPAEVHANNDDEERPILGSDEASTSSGVSTDGSTNEHSLSTNSDQEVEEVEVEEDNGHEHEQHQNHLEPVAYQPVPVIVNERDEPSEPFIVPA